MTTATTPWTNEVRTVEIDGQLYWVERYQIIASRGRDGKADWRHVAWEPYRLHTHYQNLAAAGGQVGTVFTRPIPAHILALPGEPIYRSRPDGEGVRKTTARHEAIGAYRRSLEVLSRQVILAAFPEAVEAEHPMEVCSLMGGFHL